MAYGASASQPHTQAYTLTIDSTYLWDTTRQSTYRLLKS